MRRSSPFSLALLCTVLMLVPRVGVIAAPAPNSDLVQVAFTALPHEASDAEVKSMVDEVIRQCYGPRGLESIIHPGNKVVIKVNIVAPNVGKESEKGRGIITDPRITRYIAEKVRAIIGTGGTADLKVVDATFTDSPDPSEKNNPHSFYFARLERGGQKGVDAADICYDENADGVLDGTSSATLVNLDSVMPNDRFTTTVVDSEVGNMEISMPNFLRTRAQAEAAFPDPKSPNRQKYCDVFIGLPILKSHSMAGVTGAVKLHYGFCLSIWNRLGHNGTDWNPKKNELKRPERLDHYIIAQHRVRTYDFILMDCLTGNRAGPTSPSQKDDEAVDFIPVNAMTAGTDPIAIDTVAALLGGYELSSVEFLGVGNRLKVGTDDPARIRIEGLDQFGKHRKGLYDQLHPANRYPFRDGWGQAHVLKSFDAPAAIAPAAPVKQADGTYRFDYTIAQPGIDRVELLIDGKLAACNKVDASAKPGPGSLKAAIKGKHAYRLAVWDRTLNCTLSDAKEMEF